ERIRYENSFKPFAKLASSSANPNRNPEQREEKLNQNNRNYQYKAQRVTITEPAAPFFHLLGLCRGFVEARLKVRDLRQRDINSPSRKPTRRFPFTLIVELVSRDNPEGA